MPWLYEGQAGRTCLTLVIGMVHFPVFPYLFCLPPNY